MNTIISIPDSAEDLCARDAHDGLKAQILVHLQVATVYCVGQTF